VNERLESLIARFKELDLLIQDPSLAKDPSRYRDLMREHSQLSELVEANNELTGLAAQLADTQALIQEEKDPEMREMAKEELRDLEDRYRTADDRIKFLLIPKDPLDEKNIIMEIRGGAGGDEAALFAADLYRMYTRFAEGKGWKIEVMSSSETELGGLKEIVFSVSGKNVYENMRYESGVHRVQRVPATEASGRIHTSTATVAVLPEAERRKSIYGRRTCAST
jgi:peptide chain release factor 1